MLAATSSIPGVDLQSRQLPYHSQSAEGAGSSPAAPTVADFLRPFSNRL